ncbi:hypothetical protein [Chryseobacterium lathyri]|jgi:hypothetical protein|uniref:Lipoprotein n=1 Tax=Chryseobacterium lathyri TaxID=395933 RepID=A0A511Y6I9_9FLAO|nr:hypothetical protein [Chryseobacterium lathyri]GEN70812.1 hypothetical protein CLA01_08840 [Chryseobacterium lathyri]
MKTMLIAAILLLAVSCKNDKDKAAHTTSVSTDSMIVKKDSPQQNTDDPIAEIKKEYGMLQAQLEEKKLRSNGFTYNCNEEPSGKVTFFSDKGEIKVIEHFYTEQSHFSASERYFIKNGEPFFIFREETVWNFDGGTPEKPITKDDITEMRIYLQHNKPLKCLEKKYSIRSDSKEKNISDQISGKEIQCNTDELLKTYQSLLKHKDQKREIKCL